MGMFAYLRRLLAMVRFAGSTVLTAVTLAAFAGVTPALSADYDYGRYGERPSGYPVQVYPQQSDDYEQPREYRVIIYPVRRPGEYLYDREPNGYRAPPYAPNAYPSGYDGAVYGPNGYGDRGYGPNYREGYVDGRYGPEGVLLPPAPVGPPRRAPIVYAPPYTWQ